MDYPKLPDGPCSPGAAAVRGLGDVSFQRKVGADYVAHKKDRFSRVTKYGGIKYLVAGTLVGTLSTNPPVAYGADTYGSAAHTVRVNMGVECDYGMVEISTYSALSYQSYPSVACSIPTSTNTGVVYQTSTLLQTFSITDQIYIGAANATALQVAQLGHAGYSKEFLSNSYVDSLSSFIYGAQHPYSVYPATLYLGRVNNGGGNEAQTITFYGVRSGVDTYSKPVFTPHYTIAYSKSPPSTGSLPLYGNSRSNYNMSSAVASSSIIYLLVYERFNFYGPPDSSVVVPRTWLYASNTGGAAWTAIEVQNVIQADFDPILQNVAVYSTVTGTYNSDGVHLVPYSVSGYFHTTQIPLVAGVATITDTTTYSRSQDYYVVQNFDGIHTPGVTKNPSLPPYGPTPVDPFTVSQVDSYNGCMAYVANGKWVMCANNTALYAFMYVKTVSGTPMFCSKIVAFSNTAGVSSARVVYTATPSSTNVGYIQHMVYLGNNVVVAKKVSGFGGTGFTVSFLKSTDGGTTWLEFSPAGFDAPLLNQYYGEFFLDKAESSTSSSRLLITSWNPQNASYYIYHSEDRGVTWKRGAKIGSPASFLRIDTMVGGDGGGNFNTIHSSALRLRSNTVDDALPTRYVRTA